MNSHVKKESEKELIQCLVKEINKMATKEMKIMEVCGTHTQMISKLGIRSLLSPKIKLLSGPGCPVCVTDELYIDTAIRILNEYDVTIATFGDLLRVKGSEGSLLDEKAKGKDVRIIYSPLDLIKIAKNNREKKIVFLGVGFETTAPIIALVIKKVYEKGIDNLFFLTSIKRMSPILHYILRQPKCQIQGMICPGHVASVKGADYFKFISEEYHLPAAICGFEALDILGGIYYLVTCITNDKKNTFQNLYKRCVKPQGNSAANVLLEEVFQVSSSQWRGIGRVDYSSLIIGPKFEKLNAERVFKAEAKYSPGVRLKEQCECGDILLGNKDPKDCKLFDRLCNPWNPYGPCMVSSEGACSVAYHYK